MDDKKQSTLTQVASSSSHDSAIIPTVKALSELYLISRHPLSPSRLLNTGKSISFHAYKTEPALLHLSISDRDHSFTVRYGPTDKGPILAHSYPGKESKEYIIVQSFDKFKSKFHEDGKDLYSWRVSSSQWALKQDSMDDETTLVETEQVFQWRRMTIPEGTKATFALPNWKLFNKSTGEAHAVYIENWDSSGVRGQLQFRRSFGTEWEMAVLLTVSVIAENERKRKWSGSFVKGFWMYS